MVFGRPETPAAILNCNPWECTILLQGELRPGMALYTPFPFPDSLTDQQKRRGFVRMGLVYTPTLDTSKGVEYCQTNVNASLGRLIKDSEGDSQEVPERDTSSSKETRKQLFIRGRFDRARMEVVTHQSVRTHF